MLTRRAIELLFIAAVFQCIACSRESPDVAPSSPTNTKVSSRATALTDRLAQSDAQPERPPAESITQQPNSGSTQSLPAEYLATESRFVEPNGITKTAAQQVLASSTDFSRALQDMGNEAIRNADAQDLADHYRKALSEAVGADGAIAGFACGLSLCMGSVQTRLHVDSEGWTGRFLDSPSIRVFGHMSALERKGDINESRFVFSTDPYLPGIVVALDD